MCSPFSFSIASCNLSFSCFQSLGHVAALIIPCSAYGQYPLLPCCYHGLHHPKQRSPGATELRNRSATSLMDGCPKEKDLPEFEKTTESTVAPHRMESSLAFLNRPWRCLEN
jgi:hypothetical protein